MKYATGIETKKRIVDAAFKLMAHRGFDALSIDDIMKSIGRTKGSFYVHFNSKEELLYEIMETRLDRGYNQLADEILEELSREPCQVRPLLEKITKEVYSSLGENRLTWTSAFYHLLIHSRKNEVVQTWLKSNAEQWSSLLNHVVEKGQETGQIRTDVDAQVITNMMMGIVMGYDILYMIDRPVNDEEVNLIHDWMFV
ncbi:TetR/AcrR family transcriptional regulator [Thermoactinomyces mirandus]|uniref:TetR/AcrR family transcriptional regulator n=1 Tax=Thermoactinomyces mirandus TaxID=2756294 RepID=A0A7W2ARP8_9BACL|nr:TetR/AcrR family transcriptional regulator [Thermoactinomyces mirandus]MBA4602632.1 TetR/AcrR family transcriptional regulator [Thermoactinomyces mirandus]